MEVDRGERLRDGGVYRKRRDDIEQRNARDALGMIERHAMRNPAAAVMADDRESAEAEFFHDLDLILRHRALRITGVIVAVGRLAAIAVPTQISRDNSEFLRQSRRDQPPFKVRLRPALQEQHRGSGPADHAVDARTGG